MGTKTKNNSTTNGGRKYSPIARLIQLGRKKSFVTINDILEFFPDAEQDVEQLEEAFSALISAGIPYIEDADLLVDPSDEDLKKEAQEGGEEEEEPKPADDLANIDTDDTIGLYLKEVSRVPLLTATEEVELAQRIESGRMARKNWPAEMSPIAAGSNYGV